LKRQSQQFKQLRVVVEHLLEMRHEPLLVHRVTGEAAAKVIVNAALAHAGERMLDGLKKADVVGAKAGTPQHLQNGRLRKFWCAAHTAVDGIEHIADLHCDGCEFLQSNRRSAGWTRLLG